MGINNDKELLQFIVAERKYREKCYCLFIFIWMVPVQPILSSGFFEKRNHIHIPGDGYLV